jgi:hypothetical protein
MRAMRKLVVFLSVALLLIGTTAACEGDEGDECSKEGVVDGQCDDGLVCGKKKNSNDLACLKQCTNPGDCPGNQECNGVANTSLKGCRPK